MHQGQIPGPSNSHDVPANHQPGGAAPPGRPPGSHANGSPEGSSAEHASYHIGKPSEPQGITSNTATSLDDLLSGAAKEADKADAKQAEPQEDKRTKKEKEKSTRLVYSDNNTSPEEKMAQMPRYAFVPSGKEESMPGGAVVAAITVTTGPED